MMRPKNTSFSIRPTILIACLVITVPAVLMAFISMPSQHSLAQHERDGVINIEELMRKVLELNKVKKHQEAIDLLLAAIEKNRDDSLLKSLLTETFQMFLEDEVRLGQDEIKANAHNVDAYLRVAGALELMGDNFRSMEILVNGVSLNPEAASLWMKVGKLEHKSARDLEALDVFREVIRLEPKSSDAYNNAAFVLAQAHVTNQEDLKMAENYASKAHRIDPKNPEYLDTLAEVHFRQGNQSMAMNLIKEAIKLAPERDFFKTQLRRFGVHEGLKAE